MFQLRIDILSIIVFVAQTLQIDKTFLSFVFFNTYEDEDCSFFPGNSFGITIAIFS